MSPLNLDTLLSPFQLTAALRLNNRLLMAPLTRCMADDNLCPTRAMADYYAKRADVGLIISEGTIIRPDGQGYPNVPGIYSAAQVEAWRGVTDAVHQGGGKIFAQLWHAGRVSHPHFLHGDLPLSASKTSMCGEVKRSPGLNYGQSREASLTEIQALIDDYGQAASNAIEAGFDGVEFHGANGYLIDQFLHYDTNHRQDDYGGSPENMARFALEVIEAGIAAIGADRVAIRLSPAAYLNEIVPQPRDPQVFEYLLHQLNKLSLAYVHTGCFDDKLKHDVLGGMGMSEFIRQHYQGTLVACGSYSIHEASEAIHHKACDCVAIGRPFIANPDLMTRIGHRQALHDYDVSMLKHLI